MLVQFANWSKTPHCHLAAIIEKTRTKQARLLHLSKGSRNLSKGSRFVICPCTACATLICGSFGLFLRYGFLWYDVRHAAVAA